MLENQLNNLRITEAAREMCRASVRVTVRSPLCEDMLIKISDRTLDEISKDYGRHFISLAEKVLGVNYDYGLDEGVVQ